MLEVFTLVALVFAVLSTMLFLRNLVVFRPAPAALSAAIGNASLELPAVSVLIPARDEEHGIRQTLAAVLANRGVDFEVVVLDDQSGDDTPSIVRDIESRDNRVRMIRGQPLPAGWCGKQYACQQLAENARYDELLFIDADVHLTPDAIRRCLLQRSACGVDLLSGFPRQVVGTAGEALLIPLIHIVLLTYLPFRLMRETNRASASAGCGQLFLTTRGAYQQAGGHAAIKASMHDGVTLPRVFRQAGCSTDVFDASDLANCRMYRGWKQTYRGVLKNAHEGIANRRLIVPATLLMMMGYAIPTLLAVHQLVTASSSQTKVVAVFAAAISYVPRIVTAVRFDRAWGTALMFPLSILLFVILQWIAFVKCLFRSRSTWRGRAYTTTSA